uniref:Ribosomal protein L10 n=1 Tax=Andalucia godoyi TaxID=505711 RepID=M4QKG8_ANDGO|nr:ribosomal protein L10 [Andalucia godoyi]AGH23968.1 ribosomal protein L10 [Andalucia godoyi]
MNLKKQQSLLEWKEILETSSILAVYQQNGFQSHEMIAFLQYLQRHGLSCKISKNTTVRHLVQNTSLASFGNLFEGPCLVVYTKQKDLTSPFSLQKTFSKLSPLGAYVMGGYLNGSEFLKYSEKQSLFEDYVHLAHLILSPASDLLLGLQYSSGELSSSLEVLSKKDS